MPDDVDQRQVSESETNFGHDDSNLRQRRKSQCTLNVGLHPGSQRAEDRGQQSDDNDTGAEKERCFENRTDTQQ